ncbi:MAG: hypothetical protein ACE5NM_07160 [Sedimentisphaerales bacterium]
MREQRTEDRGQRTENGGQKTDLCRLSSAVCLLTSVFCLLVFSGGCENASKGKISLAEQIEKLNEEKTRLQQQLEQAGAENEKLRKRLQVLSGLPEDLKGENLYRLQSIKISRYTNLYDKDKDDKKEQLIVYIQPIDQDGDIIKAAGAVDVQLWDLSKESQQALLGQWHVGPETLKKLWFATLMTHYKLTFDVADKIDEFKEPLTVKVTFTDYLTGKVFKEQKVIKP